MNSLIHNKLEAIHFMNTLGPKASISVSGSLPSEDIVPLIPL